LICLALAILTIITFWSLKDCGFTNFDDDLYVTENAYVQSGLNANSIGQALSFSSELEKKSGWTPLTWLSLMLDYQIFGLNPQGYHLMNLLFHVMNTILLFLIFHRMTKKLWPSAFVACLFAIHPLHVESVAWIAERPDVISTFFFMLTIGAYSYYVEHQGFRRYSLVLLFFVLGLMAKSMLVTLPFVLLLLDYWPLQRFGEITGIKPSAARDNSTDASNFIPTYRDSFSASLIRIGVSTIKPDHKVRAVKETLEIKKPADPEYKWSLIYPLLWEKVPLFILTIFSSALTYIDAQSTGYINNEAFPLGVRIENALVSYIAYIGKMIWPSNLAVFYPHPRLLVPWQVLGSVLLLIAITLVVIWRAKKFPYLATGWLWYIGTLVPVIGIVQLGMQAMADRYTYIPLIGLFIMVAWGVPTLIKSEEIRKKLLFPVGVASLAILAVLTWQQCGYWKNSINLWNHALKVTDNNSLAYFNRGNAYNYLGNYKQAIEDFNKTIEINPGYVKAYNNRGVAYRDLGNYSQAIENYDRAIEIKPGYAEIYFNRGNAYNDLGNYKQAIEDFGRVIEIKPGFIEAYYNRGVAYNSLGNYRQAIDDFSRTIEIKPDYVNAYKNRAVSYLKQGDNISCCRDAQKACELGNCKLLEMAKVKGYCR
jgi:tetratricopeptide (TPR) repeat protein